MTTYFKITVVWNMTTCGRFFCCAMEAPSTA